MTSSPSLPLLLIEAFAQAPHQGNGATVVALEAPASPDWMQAVAASLRQSETAFVVPWGDAWAIRWFTPSCEVQLCGHATLAATQALGHWGSLLPGETTRFHSRSGPLTVSLTAAAGHPGVLTASIDLPSTELVDGSPPSELRTLVRERLDCAIEKFWTSALGYSVALLESRTDLSSLLAPADHLPAACRSGLVLMQSLSDDSPQAPEWLIEGGPADYQLRFFAPGLGIPEDPVTGSAHALVAPYWQQRLNVDLVRGWQCSPQGGGMVCERVETGVTRLRGPGHLLFDGRLSWTESLCDPESWSALFPESMSR